MNLPSKSIFSLKRLPLFLLLVVFLGASFTLFSSPGDFTGPAEAVAASADSPDSEEAAAAVEGAAEGEESTPAYPPAPELTEADYPQLSWINGRIVSWLVAQLHLWFAAFVLAVPIFVFILEVLGMTTKDDRYDDMGYEFMKVSLTAYSFTAVFGGVLLFCLVIFYPDFMGYMVNIFGDTMLIYALTFFAESACLYIYYYGWKYMRYGTRKWIHLSIGLLLNGVGTFLMFMANSWVTFMMSPGGIDGAGVFSGNVWEAIHTHLWNPVNLHRFVANIAYGGSIVGAYAAFKFLSASTKEGKAHYDWMGYTANFIAISALIPLPFAGYWLIAEVYAYSQQMGITAMGGSFAWLFILQAVLIGALFLSANYYLWCGMGRSDGSYRYTPYIKYIGATIVICFLVWFTPHTLILESWETKMLGGQYHPYLGPLGIMPAKNTAVNIMLLSTFLSFLLYRRANKEATVSWAPIGNAVQVAIFVAAIINICYLGIYYGYFTNTVYKVASSVPQVCSTLLVIISVLIIDVFMFKGAKEVAPLNWGRVSQRSQYALFMLAVSFTWLMGLMGFIRSALRQHWHVYTIFRDWSPDAFTPSIASASMTVSVGVIIFMAFVIFIFWLADLSGRKQEAS